MLRVVVACTLAALVPIAARGEPISVEFHSASGGFSTSGEVSTSTGTVSLGQLSLSGVDAAGTFFFNNAETWRDYTIRFDLALSGVGGFRAELLDPLGDDDDGYDPVVQPAWVPAGYTTSNDFDGFSFAQRSGLDRSAAFAGGGASVAADEQTHRGDILLFTGLNGVDEARVTFGVRDSVGSRPFLLHISALGMETSPAPEPASMLLLGTGLAGVAAAVRRRRRTAAAQSLP